MATRRAVKLPVAGLLALVIDATGATAGTDWGFVPVGEDQLPPFSFEQTFGPEGMADLMSGGLAAADIDGDGWVDLYLPQSSLLPGRLLLNQRDGSFIDVSQAWDLVVSNGNGPIDSAYATGAAFVDLDGDGRRELVLAGLRQFGLRIYRNLGDRFEQQDDLVQSDTGALDHYSVGIGDVDRNGYPDLLTGHWGSGQAPLPSAHLWLNGGQVLEAAGIAWALSGAFAQASSGGDFTFTPNLADLNRDGWPDLLFAADFRTTRYFHNDAGTGFLDRNDAEISDENGMGAAVGDFDGDGNLDWFVTSIFDLDPPPDLGQGGSGNRLYLNDGDGRFIDATESAGVRDGGWGWGACAADFDLDGQLDLFHVNGWNAPGSRFSKDRARLFINQGNAAFTDQAGLRGIDDDGQGRGIVCFDADRDGDIDIVIQSNQARGIMYRNTAAETTGHFWLGLRLRGAAPNTDGLGAWIELTAGGQRQVHEMQIPNHYLSTSPAERVFGLGSDDALERVEVRWPDGSHQVLTHLLPNRWIVLAANGVDRLFDSDFE